MNDYAKRIERLRLNAGKTIGEMADIMNLTYESYCDLEAYDDEVLTCISLAQLQKICSAFNVSPITLLAGEAKQVAGIRRISNHEFTEKIRGYISAQGITISEFEDRIGWHIESLLENPELLAELDVEFVQNACREIGIDWLAVLPA